MYEYFPLPAMFVDYTMRGQGINQPRLITMTLHIITDEMPDASNISEQKNEGVMRFMYNLLIQSILDGTTLGKTTALSFTSEDVIDAPAVNYHTQSYEFEAFIADMMGNIDEIIEQFDSLNIFGSITKTFKTGNSINAFLLSFLFYPVELHKTPITQTFALFFYQLISSIYPITEKH